VHDYHRHLVPEFAVIGRLIVAMLLGEFVPTSSDLRFHLGHVDPWITAIHSAPKTM
jgi:hypothetical protein